MGLLTLFNPGVAGPSGVYPSYYGLASYGINSYGQPDLPIDIMFDFGNGLASVAHDALSSTISASWGATACDPMTRIATTGQIVFSLNNSTCNLAGTLGFYSPGNSNVKIGFGLETPVVLKLTYGGVTKYKRFYISQITPAPGVYGSRRVDIVAADIMGRMAVQNIAGLAVQVNKRIDQGLATLLTLLPVAPLATALSVAPETQSFLFTDITNGTAFMTAVQHLALTDAGYIFVKGDSTVGETFCYENRHERQTRASGVTISGALTGLSVPIKENQIINDVTVPAFPGNVGAVAETLYQQAKELQIRSGQTVTFQANYVDPGAGSGTPNGVILLPGSGVAPVSGTDYKATLTSGSGLNDAVAFLTVSIVWNASYALVSMTNLSNSFDVYVNPFVLRGKIIRLYSQQDMRVTDTAQNYAQYGRRPLSYPIYYQDDINFANDMACHWFNMWHLPVSIPQYGEYIANRNSTLMTAAVTLDIGSRFTMAETVTGVNADYNIMGIDMKIEQGKILTVRYFPEPTNLIPDFILDDAVYGVLDTGPGRLSF